MALKQHRRSADRRRKNSQNKMTARDRKIEKTKDYLRRWLAMVDSWPNGVTCSGVGDRGDQLAEEIVAEIRKLVYGDEHGCAHKQTAS